MVEGVTTSADETWKVGVRLIAELLQRGVVKTSLESCASGNPNPLVVRTIPDSALRDTPQVMAIDKDSLEIGRGPVPINAITGNGGFYQVHFPARTDLNCSLFGIRPSGSDDRPTP